MIFAGPLGQVAIRTYLPHLRLYVLIIEPWVYIRHPIMLQLCAQPDNLEGPAAYSGEKVAATEGSSITAPPPPPPPPAPPDQHHHFPHHHHHHPSTTDRWTTSEAEAMMGLDGGFFVYGTVNFE